MPKNLEKRHAWESVTRVPLVVLGLVFIVTYTISVLDTDEPLALIVTWTAIALVTWVAFAVDYFVRLGLTPRTQRGHFFSHNLIDALSVLLPVFRALRVVNLLRDIPYFRKRTGAAVRTQVITFAASYAILYVFFLALATLSVERHAPHATITSFGQAIWWACTTLSTVGYGDTYPVTVQGRVYAVLLMIGGIAIVGTASALVFSYISERVGQARTRVEALPPATED